MTFRIILFFSCIGLNMLFPGAAMANAIAGDWESRSEVHDASGEKRIAFTSAHSHSGSGPEPKLVISRSKPGSSIDLMITATHDETKDECDYKDWKIAIDGTDVPVLGYTFEPAKTELKAKLGAPSEQLWDLFRKGLALTIEVDQKCASNSGLSNPVSYRFSLRGSYAAYMFVLQNGE